MTPKMYGVYKYKANICVYMSVYASVVNGCSQSNPTDLKATFSYKIQHSILLLPLGARCLETIDVCIWIMFVFMSVVVTVWGSVGSLLCSGRC